jgi:hypothetical protein
MACNELISEITFLIKASAGTLFLFLGGAGDVETTTGCDLPSRLETADLYRVNFEVNNLKPFPYLVFRTRRDLKQLENALVLMAN